MTNDILILIYGATGWIGSQMKELLRLENMVTVKGLARLDNYADVIKELDDICPTHVLIAAGKTGRPNVDWCEDHKTEVLQTNVLGTTVLIDECYKRRIHVTYFGTGCIYEYDEEHPIGGKGFTEQDEPNFDGSFYSATKIVTEKIVKEYDNVLTLRIRMPLSDDLSPRNFITKITKYEKVVDIPNSMTILNDMLPIACNMLIKSSTGIYNFTNPGVISHNEILALYKKYIDRDFTWTNFSLEDQDKILKAGRSNNCLDVTKLQSEYYIRPIKQSIIKLFQRMGNNLIDY